MRQIDLEEFKQIQLEILTEVDVFCKAKGLRFSLAAGTLLGAVRHKGFIPWDDDIDLLMPRPDYDIFCHSFSHPDLEVLNLAEKDYCVELFAKVSRKGTIMEDVAFKRRLWGVNIDIFPVDGAPDAYEVHCGKVSRLREKLSWVCPFYKAIPSNKVYWFAKYLLKRVLHCCFKSSLGIKKEIEELVRSYPFTNSPKAGVIVGAYDKREKVGVHDFDDLVQMPFEGGSYPVINNYDSYLTNIYGDYMKLPPAEQRVTHHIYDSFVVD